MKYQTKQTPKKAEGLSYLLGQINTDPFSNAAIARLESKTHQYLSNLIRESAAIAKMHETDSVSARHVEIAVDRLNERRWNKSSNLASTIGGIGLGTSLSTLCAMMLVWQFPLAGIIICIAFGIVGGYSLALNLNRE